MEIQLFNPDGKFTGESLIIENSPEVRTVINWFNWATQVDDSCYMEVVGAPPKGFRNYLLIDLFGDAIICTDQDGYNLDFNTREEAREYAEENLQDDYRIVEI